MYWTNWVSCGVSNYCRGRGVPTRNEVIIENQKPMGINHSHPQNEELRNDRAKKKHFKNINDNYENIYSFNYDCTLMRITRINALFVNRTFLKIYYYWVSRDAVAARDNVHLCTLPILTTIPMSATQYLLHLYALCEHISYIMYRKFWTFMERK